MHVWWLKQRVGFTSFFAWSTKERTFSKWGLLTRAPIRVLSSRGSPISIAQVLFTTSPTNFWRIFLWTKTRVPLLQTCDKQNIFMWLENYRYQWWAVTWRLPGLGTRNWPLELLSQHSPNQHPQRWAEEICPRAPESLASLPQRPSP